MENLIMWMVFVLGYLTLGTYLVKFRVWRPFWYYLNVHSENGEKKIKESGFKEYFNQKVEAAFVLVLIWPWTILVTLFLAFVALCVFIHVYAGGNRN